MKKTRIMLYTAAFAALLAMRAAAWTRGDYSDGQLSGVLAEEDGIVVTDVFNKVVWKTAYDGMPEMMAGKVTPKNPSGEPVGALIDGKIADACFTFPWDIVPYGEGYAVTDAESNAVRYIRKDTVETIISAREGLSYPTGLAADDKGNLYIADTGSGSIKQYAKDGTLTTFYTGLTQPTGIDWYDGALYVAETGASRIVRIRNGSLTGIAGYERLADGVYTDGFGNGPADFAHFAHPQGITVTKDGTIYVSDTDNRAIRKIEKGYVTTVSSLAAGDDRLGAPRGIAVVGDTLYAADAFTGILLTYDTAYKGYADVDEDEWYANNIKGASEYGLMQGVGDGYFDPDGTLTRAMFTTMLSRVALFLDGNTVIGGDAAFEDVEKEQWYTDAVAWAADNEIVKGIDDGFFSPDEPVTREQLVTMMYRYSSALKDGFTAKDDVLHAFTDADTIEPYAVDAMKWAVEYRLINGFEDGTLRPGDTADRAQAAKIMTVFLLNWFE